MLRRVLYIGHLGEYSLHEAFFLPVDRSRVRAAIRPVPTLEVPTHTRGRVKGSVLDL